MPGVAVAWTAVSDGPDDDLTTKGGLRLPAHAIEWRFSRGSGPGGQHRNTADTAAELVADLTALEGRGADRVRERLGHEATAAAAESRSQWRNRSIAMRKLGEELDEAARPTPRRRPTRPSRAARRRRLEEKRQHAEKKQRRRWRWGG